MSSLGSPNPFFIAGKKAYEVERSLRFNDNDTAYLSRNFQSGGNRKKWTFSAWIKRSNLGGAAGEMRIFGGSTNASHIFITSSDSLTWDVAAPGSSASANLTTTQKFRDVSAWFHLVCAFDTDNSTANNRMRIYINGTEVTSFGTRTNPSSGYASNAINADAFADGDRSLHTIGYRTSVQGSAGMEFDGYMAEINFIDGQQYDPSYFGETNAATGQWNPKKYVGGYGTTGFYLNFSDNSGTTATTLGKDTSGNGNNFTPNNFSVSAGAGNDSVEDTPTNNFSTFNPLFAYSTNFATFSNGNLDHSLAVSQIAASSFLIPKTGKWYAEFVLTAGALLSYLGVRNPALIESNYSNGISMMQFTDDGSSLSAAAQVRVDNSYVETLSSSYADNDILGIKVDRDAGTIQFTKNGSNISTAINLSGASDTSDLVFVLARSQSGSYSFAGSVNFGQRPFSYLPTDYKSLSSQNLPDLTIKLPNKHFDTLLYSGNGSDNRDITGLNFAPDWVWLKRRDGDMGNNLGDTVRGANKILFSNSANAEMTSETDRIKAFNSDGFRLGTDSAVNFNGYTYVAWNWNAGDTDGKTYAVTVVSDSGNKYRFDGFGTSAVTLDLAEGGTYIFDQSDSSNAGHPLRFSTTSNGTHGGGSEYTTGVTTAGTPGSSGAYTQIVIAASAPTLYYYCTNHSGMGGQANTNSTLGSSNFDGSVQSTAKVNATAGFSIVTLNGTGSVLTFGHGLGVKPDAVILKARNIANNWLVFHQGYGATKTTFLDTNSSTSDNAQWYNDTEPTSSVFTLGTWSGMNTSTPSTIVAYCFNSVEGYSKFGSYTGNGSSDGTFVFTGFRPAWVMIKNTSGTGLWIIADATINSSNVVSTYLQAQGSNGEYTGYSWIDLLSNGFKARNTGSSFNTNGSTMIYLAFSESPFKNARAR